MRSVAARRRPRPFFVLLLYVYASAVVFLAGAQLDACVRAAANE